MGDQSWFAAQHNRQTQVLLLFRLYAVGSAQQNLRSIAIRHRLPSQHAGSQVQKPDLGPKCSCGRGCQLYDGDLFHATLHAPLESLLPDLSNNLGHAKPRRSRPSDDLLKACDGPVSL